MRLNLYDLIKQLYISIRLESNPNYYTLVDIKRALKRIHKIIQTRRVERDEMELLVYYQESMKQYMKVFTGKSEYEVEEGDYVSIAMDCYNEISEMDWFLKEIEERDPNYRR